MHITEREEARYVDRGAVSRQSSSLFNFTNYSVLSGYVYVSLNLTGIL